MNEEHTSLSIGQALKSMLPKGTASYLDDEGETNSNINSKIDDIDLPWREPPIWPTDLFAATAHLIHSSGLLNYFEPDPDYSRNASANPICFTITAEERAVCVNAGLQWSTVPEVPRVVYRLWKKLISAWDLKLRASTYSQLNKRRKSPDWWGITLQLLIIADEASVGLGAPPSAEYPERWLVDVFQQIYAQPFRTDNQLKVGAYRADRQPITFGFESDADIGCVQPKNRIASVGCNMRNLSRNLAYVSHAGSVRCHWQQPIYSALSEDSATLDVLIIPLPFNVPDSSIAPSNVLPDPEKRPNWGNFEIKQVWLEDEEKIFNIAINEINKAKKYLKNNNVNAVIFPEYSLTEDCFSRICDHLKRIEPQLEFAICGSSSNCDGEAGNFVLTALWYDEGLSASAGDNKYLLTSRRKHHRWKLSGEQVKDYGLESILPPETAWWETHMIAQRELHFFHFRQTSVFTSMICEDLARSDPCHDILRSVGPNLLFALLMDGPQIKHRWPARYASTLAEDPGTAVLTITSMGLIARSNDTDRYPDKSTSIALWRDDTGDVKELELEQGCQSVILTLKADLVQDQTLDGRLNPHARSWRYESHKSL